MIDATAQVLAAEHIKVSVADRIAVVTLNRPESRNAMSYAMWRAMPDIFGALERDAEVRAVILTGAGADFCAGADIPEFERVRADVAQSADYEVAVDACCDAIAAIAKPTIAVLRGYCLGGGMHLAMACDFRFAAADAVFGIPAARLGIVYGAKGTRRLLALVGLPEAKRVLYGAQRFGADQALRSGFVDRVADTGADPIADARAFAESLVGNAPLSVAGAKFLLDGMAMGVLDAAQADRLIERAAGSDDYREGRAAFADKREPRFNGR